MLMPHDSTRISDIAPSANRWFSRRLPKQRAPRKHRLGGAGKTPFWLQLPENPDSERVLLLLHGISRNAEALVHAFAPAAQAAGYVTIAPLFEKGKYPDFQRLGRRGKGPRIDLILQAILEEVSQALQMPIERVDVFGFSAGAQLGHRFAMAYPQMVRKMALGSAGWYTFPSNDRYPYGLRLKGELPGLEFVPERFLRIPTRVFVGDQDTHRDESLNRSKRVDGIQGLHRLERATHWVQAINQEAIRRHLSPQAKLEVMPGVAHSFTQACQMYSLPLKITQWVDETQPLLAAKEGKQ